MASNFGRMPRVNALKLRLVALVALMLAAAVIRPAATTEGYCVFVWASGEQNGDYAYGWSQVESNWSSCWVGETYAAVDLSTPSGSNSGNGFGYGSASAGTYVPIAPGGNGTAVVHAMSAMEVFIWNWEYYGYEYLDEYAYYQVSSSGGGEDPPGQCAVFGTVFFDYNENGIFDGGDVPYAGTVVYLNDYWDTYGIDAQATNSSGYYQFNIQEGSYRVKHPVPSGYVRTTDDSVPFSACSYSYNFGIAPAPAPTITFSPDSMVTADYNSGDVIITATITPPDQGWEGQLQWSNDDLPQFVPGANLNGTSVPIQPEGTALQQVRVIAAFVNAAGQIVPPPVTEVTFTLPESTAFPGYAMNAGTGTAPDFAFVPAQQQVTTGFSGNLAWAVVGVFDYGGRATARVSAAGFQPVEIQIPKDNANNGIADAGWRAYGHQGHPAQQADDCVAANCQWQEDIDGTPTGTGPPNYGATGDGLVIWEEYRGFVVRGTHVRTHPGYKDLFVASTVTASGLDAFTALQYARDNLRANTATMTEIGVRLHLVWGEDNLDIPPGQFIEYKLDPQVTNPHQAGQRRINFNESLTAPVALNSQKAVRIRPNGLAMGTAGQWDGFCYPLVPAGTPPVGGGVPFSTKEVLIDVSQHQGNQHELKRTIAHELGHAINIMHRGGNTPDGCPDGATVGTGTSVMSPFTPNGSGNVSSTSAQYNGNDVPQIRIRWNP